jgi:cell division protein FtsL
MTPLSRCELLDRSRVLFRGKAFFCLVSLLAVVVGLAMGQVHLRFLARDLQIETGKLQRAREDLQNRKTVVVSEVERLKRYETIREYAESRLGLRECLPGQTCKAVVSAEVVAKWSDAANAPAQPADVSSKDGRSWLNALGEKVVTLSSVSMAREK